MFNKTKEEIISIIKKLKSWDYNFSSMFISPIWYTIIKTYFENNKLDINKNIFWEHTNSFLKSLWFFEENEYCIWKLKQNRILPIKTINSQEGKEIEVINNEFHNLLKEFLWAENISLTRNISSMIWELLNNISNHSWETDISDNTWEVIISANFQSWQYYEWKKFIQISIVDSWIWIVSSVRKKIPNIQTAKEAILKALEARFTWWTTLSIDSKNFTWITNRWIWLTTIQETIKKLKWDLFIWTKDCLYCYNWADDKPIFEEIPTWKWTFVVFNIYTNNNFDIDFEKIKINLLWENMKNTGIENTIDFW